jgi:mRNA-degrading endonuclease toxin of MazEF toxin-antitoxin module
VAVTDKKIVGVVLSDHVKNLDWKARKVEFIGKADASVLKEVIAKFTVILGD